MKSSNFVHLSIWNIWAAMFIFVALFFIVWGSIHVNTWVVITYAHWMGWL